MKQKILLLLMLLTSLAADAWKSDYFDYTYEGVTLRYMLTGNGDCVVVHRSGDIGGAVTIPSKAASYPVTKIGSGAFKGCSSLTSVTIPNSVTEIGADAFNGCSSLTSVTIPGSVTGIGDFSFAYCNSLEKVYYDADEPTATFENVFSDFMKPTLYVKESAIDKIKATVPRIKVMNIEGMESLYELKYSFDYITSTASVTGIKIQAGVDNIDVVIPETTMNGWQVFTVAAISESAFYYCRSLSSITIPNSVTTIGEGAFYGCDNLNSVTIPNSVTTIGKRAFDRCSELVAINVNTENPNYCSINGILFSKDKLVLHCYPEGKTDSNYIIPNSVTTIADYAFSECSLASVTIPASVTTIGNSAFSNCSSLTSVIIPNSVTTIGNEAFYLCGRLTSVTIPNSVTVIGSRAFENCSSLTSVTIPNSVTEIGNRAFADCSRLDKVYYGAKIPVEAPDNIFSDYRCPTLYVKAEALNKMYITNPWACFKKIEPYDFSAINFDSSALLMFVGESSELKVITESSLSELTWSSSNPDIATVDSKGTVTALAVGETVITVSATELYSKKTLSAKCTIEVTKSLYKLKYSFFTSTATVNGITIQEEGDNIDVVIPEYVEHEGRRYTVTAIRELVFAYRSGLTSVTIPNSVTEIGNRAFVHSNKLVAINVDKDNPYLTSIDGILFNKDKTELICYPAGKPDLNYEIPNSVTSIGGSAVGYCSNLTSITIPNSVMTIGSYAFSTCIGLTSVIIGNSVTSIGDYAFSHCRSLQSVIIPNSAMTIGSYAFDSCRSLTSVVIPNSVTTIGNSAFAACSGLTSVTIPSSISTIGGGVFSSCYNLEKVYYGTEVPVTAPENVFSDYSKPTLYVKESAMDKIKATIPWSKFTNIETFDFPEMKLDTNTLSICAGATTTLNVTKVGNLSELTWTSSNPEVATVDSKGTVTALAEGKTVITVSATELESGITISASCDVEVKDKYVLTYNFDDAAYTATVTGISIDDAAETVDVTIPEYVEHEGRRYNVTEIGESAFENNIKLTSVEISNSVTTIGERAFYECSSLTSVTIPNSVITIGNNVFSGCSSLEKVYYGTDEPIVAPENVFPDYSKPTLYVKESAMDKIKSTIPWSLFENVEAYEFLGVDDIIVDDNTPTEVYNLNGLKLGDSLEGLAPGLYIVRKGSKVEKISVR